MQVWRVVNLPAGVFLLAGGFEGTAVLEWVSLNPKISEDPSVTRFSLVLLREPYTRYRLLTSIVFEKMSV